MAKYDIIGLNYSELRKPDPRIATAIHEALGTSERAPAPMSRKIGDVTAVEPSLRMIGKRRQSQPTTLQASAEDLPFANASFDAAMAILTIHHWSDKEAGPREMRRVTRGRIVLLTFDPSHRPWLTDHIPELASLDEAQMPAMSEYERWLGPVKVTPVLVPPRLQRRFSLRLLAASCRVP